MNERNKQNRDAVRQVTSGQTPAEVEAQKSLTTANPDWITSDDKKSPRQQAHVSRRGVKQAREALAEACWKGYKAKGMKKKGSKTVPNCVKEGRMDLAERVLSELSQGALERYRDKAMSQDPTTTPLKREKGISKASTKITRHKQGKSTPRSMFGGKSNQTSTTAGGGTLGQELAKTKPESQHSMNRRGSSTVDKKKVAANLADAKSGRNAANLKKEIDADTEKRRAAKRAEG